MATKVPQVRKTFDQIFSIAGTEIDHHDLI